MRAGYGAEEGNGKEFEIFEFEISKEARRSPS
jgi:hypothetical protein